VPIAKAIEYAKKLDYPAVLAYCASPEVARKIVNELWNGYHFEGELQVRQLDGGREFVHSEGDDGGFEVVRRGDRWLVVAFRDR